MIFFKRHDQNKDADQAQIVIIDDEEDLCQLLKLALKMQGYQVAVAHNGEDGLALIRLHRPAMVVLDIKMPRMNGYQVLARMQQDSTLADISIVVMTSMTNESEKSDEAWAADLGVRQFVTKPMDPDVILQAAQKYVGKPRIPTP
jgi:CheY-like chemotaxis protein